MWSDFMKQLEERERGSNEETEIDRNRKKVRKKKKECIEEFRRGKYERYRGGWKFIETYTVMQIEMEQIEEKLSTE